MSFLGADFFGDDASFDAAVAAPAPFTAVTVQNGVYDELFITKNPDQPTEPTAEKEWDYDTILYAKFDGTTTAGNIQYTVDQVSAMRIKYRESGTYDWITCYELPVRTDADFSFSKELKFLRSGVTYDVAIVPVLNGTEGNLNIASVKSEFDGLYLMEKEQSFHAPLNVSIYPISKNQSSSVITTLDGVYPFVLYNGKAKHRSGSASGLFVEPGQQDYDFDNAENYRDRLLEFMTNGKPKLLKTYHGKEYIVNIIDSPQEERDGHDSNISLSFSWVETGDCSSSADLYQSALIDVLVEGG